MEEKAIFAMGCFWHAENIFCKIPGVVKTTVGYTGGKIINPTYKQVCSGETGHAEAIKIIFDPDKISYEKLLDIFWKSHNPTSLNRQGFDVGTNYRSAIFYTSEKQKKEAIKSRNFLQRKLIYKIVTEINPEAEFYRAEECHQRYAEKHGGKCTI